MKTPLALGVALALLSGPAFAQYGGGAQNSGGPLGSYARSAGSYGYAPYYGSYYVPAPVYSWGGPAYYGYPGYYERRVYRPYARIYRRW